jgi:hypothetical protein
MSGGAAGLGGYVYQQDYLAYRVMASVVARMLDGGALPSIQSFKIADPTGLQVLKKCRVSGRRHFCHPTSFQGRGCENGRSTEDPASGS